MITLNDLKELFEKKMLYLKNNGENFNWENVDCYANWLAQTHYYVNHSTRLLALSASRFPISDQTLHRRFCKHIAEETGHENLTLLDLKNIDRKICNQPEFVSTSTFYQTQYYAIEHESPYAFFSWILMLEGLTVREGLNYYKRAFNAHGEKCTNFLKVHCEEDPDHLTKAFDALKLVPESELKTVGKFFEISCELYSLMLLDCEKSALTLKKIA